MSVTADGIGSSDCETVTDALLAQPVNALTSFAYVVVGAVIVIVAVRSRRAVLPSAVYGVCVAAIGLGSLLFHGPQPAGSRLLHDLPILVTASFIVVADVELLRPQLRHPLIVWAALSVVAAAVSASDADVGAAATGATVAAALVLEVIIHRRRARPIPPRRQLMLYGTIAGIAVVAGAAYALGRTGSPVCEPGSVVQFHGLWHLVSAAIFGAWWWLAYRAPEAAPDRPPVLER